jgi:hypothetical protein
MNRNIIDNNNNYSQVIINKNFTGSLPNFQKLKNLC